MQYVIRSTDHASRFTQHASPLSLHTSQHPFHHHIQIELGGNAGAGGRAHFGAAGGIGEQVVDRGRQRRGITRGHDDGR